MNSPGNIGSFTTAVYSVLQMREAEQRPIRVGVIGAGATGRAIALQLGTPVPGMRLPPPSQPTPAHPQRAPRAAGVGERALREAGSEGWRAAKSASDAAARIARGAVVVADDPEMLTRCDA